VLGLCADSLADFTCPREKIFKRSLDSLDRSCRRLVSNCDSGEQHDCRRRRQLSGPLVSLVAVRFVFVSAQRLLSLVSRSFFAGVSEGRRDILADMPPAMCARETTAKSDPVGCSSCP
ncbi:unnamed protein product, partial [Ixodes persulcatus]